ncbi:MAG: DUF4344 domain-containing metallopeptidase [Acidiferrobacterales bacterium]
MGTVRGIANGLAVCLLFIALSAYPISNASSAEKTEGQGSIEISPDKELFFLGNTFHVLLHEFGHVLIQDLDLPVLGREEDAADTIATLLVLGIARKSPDSNNPFIESLLATAQAWQLVWEQEQRENQALQFWSRHSLSAQRFYNIVCFIYGSDPERFARLPKAAKLPEARSEWCEEELELAARSLRRLGELKALEKQALSDEKTGSIAVVYDEPQTALSSALLAALRQTQMIEKLAEHFETRFALPADLKVRVWACGFPGAGWDPEARELNLCYEFMELYYGLAERADPDARKRLLERASH